MRTYKVRWLQLDGRDGDFFGVYSVEDPDDGEEHPDIYEKTMVGPLAIFPTQLDAMAWEPPTSLFPSGNVWHEVNDRSGFFVAMFPSKEWADSYVKDTQDYTPFLDDVTSA